MYRSSHFSCYIIVWILHSKNLVTHISFKVPPRQDTQTKTSEKFFEEITAPLTHEVKHDAEFCNDITCDIKTAKVSFFEVKKGKASSFHFQYSGVHFLTMIHFEYTENGWIDIVIKNYSSGILKNMLINSDLGLSPTHQDFAYTQNSMAIVFLNISCSTLNYLALSRISIVLTVSENSGKYSIDSTVQRNI